MFNIGQTRTISQANEREQKTKELSIQQMAGNPRLWLAEEDLSPKETPLQWEQQSIVLMAFVAVLAIKKCFWW